MLDESAREVACSTWFVASDVVSTEPVRAAEQGSEPENINDPAIAEIPITCLQKTAFTALTF